MNKKTKKSFEKLFSYIEGRKVKFDEIYGILADMEFKGPMNYGYRSTMKQSSRRITKPKDSR